MQNKGHLSHTVQECKYTMKFSYLHLTCHSPPSQNTNYKEHMFDKIDIRVSKSAYSLVL